jgi:hypothetical protein
MAGELALLRQEAEQKGAEVDTLQAHLTEALTAKEQFSISNRQMAEEPDPDANDMRLPLHSQEEVMQKIQIPGTDAGYCIGIDHQGKCMRYLSVDGQWLTVFPRFSDAYYSFDVNVDVLRDLGMPAACLRRDVAGGWTVSWLPSCTQVPT